jgi:hypothetical protein
VRRRFYNKAWHWRTAIRQRALARDFDRSLINDHQAKTGSTFLNRIQFAAYSMDA